MTDSNYANCSGSTPAPTPSGGGGAFGACGSGWGAVGAVGSAAINSVFGLFENKASNKSNQLIANSQNQTIQTIDCRDNQTKACIAARQDQTNITVAQINAQALQNKPAASLLGTTSILMITVGFIMVVAVVGVFAVGVKDAK